MPAAIAVPLILGGTGAVTGLVGAKIASNASKHAADTQAQAAQQAMQYSQQNTARTLDYLGRAQAATHAPGSAYGTLSKMMGLGTPAAPPMMASGQPSTPFPMPTPVGSGQTPAAANSGGGMVLMRAPNGATQQVPQDQVAHYQQLGAQVVG